VPRHRKVMIIRQVNRYFDMRHHVTVLKLLPKSMCQSGSYSSGFFFTAGCRSDFVAKRLHRTAQGFYEALGKARNEIALKASPTPRPRGAIRTEHIDPILAQLATNELSRGRGRRRGRERCASRMVPEAVRSELKVLINRLRNGRAGTVPAACQTRDSC
jgi:hypothetical protein